ncbi:hypothetical protein BJX64DRAFT_149226 [Aspergillus heterothallicus]
MSIELLTIPTSLTATTPLTTLSMNSIFTPPASCSSSWTYEPQAANQVYMGLLIQNAAPNDGADPACFPPHFNKYGRKTADAIYSPGYCPEGYTSANLVVTQPTTTAICCLSHFTYTTEVMEYGNAVYAGCTRMLPSTTSMIVTVRETEGYSTQITGPITMWAQPITVELQASDLSLFVAENTTATTTTTTTRNITTSTTSTAASLATATTPVEPTTTGTEESTDSSASGISTGAGIGIGVGVGAGGLAVLGAVIVWFLRRRRASKVSAMHGPYQGSSWNELPAAKPYAYRYPFELDAGASRKSRSVHELHG